MNQHYKIDFGGGSPFEVYDGSGNVMFDARYSTMRVTQNGIVLIGANSLATTVGTSAFADIMLSRTRGSLAPLYNVVGYAQGAYFQTNYRYSSPNLFFFSSFLYGFWANGLSDRLRIGNQSWTGGMTGYYAIYDNSAG